LILEKKCLVKLTFSIPGYLDYMKKLGYTMAHIWACPPSEGDDYIFHSHPNEQKIPKPKRLQVNGTVTLLVFFLIEI